MARAKKAAKAEPTTAPTAKPYRHTRTGAVRFSSSPLGYPFEAVDTKVEKAPTEEVEE